MDTITTLQEYSTDTGPNYDSDPVYGEKPLLV